MGTAQLVIDSLRRFDLTDEGHGKYRCNSPFRSGAEGHSFSVLIEGDERGTFYDHGHNDSGSLYDLAQRLGIDLPRKEVKDSKRAYANLDEYAAAKGVPASAFVAAGWTAEPEMHYCPLTKKNRLAIRFATAGGNRWRFIDGDPHGSSFISEKGYKSCWYGLDRAIKLATETKQSLIICNGEPSTIAAQYHGLAACALTGGEGKHIPGDCIIELKQKWKGEVLIALDCDKAGRTGAQLILQDLQNAGYTTKALDLLLGNKGDVADFCQLHGEKSVKALSELPTLYDVQLALPNSKPTSEHNPTQLPSLQTLVDQLIKVRQQADRKAEKPLDTLLDSLQAEINKARVVSYGAADKSLDDVMQEHTDWMLSAVNGQKLGFTSGLKKLDGVIGRLEENQIYTVLAETGMGKTTSVASIASALLNQAPGLIIPTELKPVYWLNKMIAALTYIPTDRIRGGGLSLNQMAHIENAKALIRMRQTRFFEGRSPKTDEVVAFAANAVAAHGAKWAIIDCLSNIGDKSSDGIFERASAAADLALELAHMGMAVICTSQVGRNLVGQSMRIPGLHDGKGSGRIEENSDVVLALYNHTKYVKSGDAEPNAAFPEGTVFMRCLKHRHNGEAEGQGVNLAYVGGVGIYDEPLAVTRPLTQEDLAARAQLRQQMGAAS